MTKSELVRRIAEHLPQLTHRDVQISVDLVLDAITESLTEGKRAEIRGFGSFNVHYRPAKVARNPKTGEPVSVPEKLVPHFKLGKGLLEAVQPEPELEPLRLAA